MACTFCRRRRIRCDGGRPNCSSCVRVKRECEYGQSVQPRGHAKKKSREIDEFTIVQQTQMNSVSTRPTTPNILDAVDAFALYNNYSTDNYADDQADVQADAIPASTPDDSDSPATPFGYNTAETFLYVEDDPTDQFALAQFHRRSSDFITSPSPASSYKEMETTLTELFFRDVYPGIPIIHKSRYYASLQLAPQMQPPLCLRNAMWALAAVQNPKWSHLANSFYEKARTYLEQDELRGAGTELLNVAHVQCWSLIATYESYMLLSLRTWSSIRRAAALAQVFRLHTMDESVEPPSPLLPETHDPSELEERRRAFWSAFSHDRWISSSTGYPMTMTETRITTKLPSSERSFNLGLIEKTQSLGDALEVGFDSNTSLYGARAVLACMLGRVMQHVGAAATFSINGNNDAFWSHHDKLDRLLSRVSSSRSEQLRPSSETKDPKLWAFDMWLYGLSICLHQSAVDCATKANNQGQLTRSLKQCRVSANHIISTVRSIAHIETKKMDPFSASCVYMASTVLTRAVAHGDSRNTDIEDLRLLQQTLELMHKNWKVTEIFITQFKEDLAQSGLNLMISPSDQRSTSRKRLGYFDSTQRQYPGGPSSYNISSF